MDARKGAMSMLNRDDSGKNDNDISKSDRDAAAEDAKRQGQGGGKKK